MEQDIARVLDGIRAVMEKSMTNAEFRRKALADAGAAVKEASGYELPAKARVRFVEETEDLVVTLPPFQGEGVEIPEEKMAEIGGGVHVYPRTNINILTAPRGEPVPFMNRNGKDVYYEPDFIKSIGEKIRGWLS